MANKKLIDSTYFVVNGCHNCARVFRKYDFDDNGSEYFCNRVKTGRRPLCGSVCMDEYESLKGKGFYTSKLYDIWLKWSKPRAVSAQGWCKYWELRHE